MGILAATSRLFDRLKNGREWARGQIGLWQGGMPHVKMEVADRALMARYKSWVYVCASMNARFVAQQPLKLYRKITATTAAGRKCYYPTRKVSTAIKDYLMRQDHLKGVLADAVDLQEVASHPSLEVFARPNAWMGKRLLIEYTQLNLELTGKGYMHGVFNRLGHPLEVWPVPTHLIKPLPHRDKFIAGYKYGLAPNDTRWSVAEVIRFIMPNPLDYLDGLGPLQGALNAADVNQKMADYENALFDNHAVPDYAVRLKRPLAPENEARMMKSWRNLYGGPKRRGRLAVLPMNIEEIQRLSESNKEMQFKDGLAWFREETCAAFSIPLSMIVSSTANRAQAFEAFNAYARGALRPRLAILEEQFTERFAQPFDDTLFFGFDDPAPPDVQQMVTKHQLYVTSGIWTPNEAREESGKPPHPDGDELRSKDPAGGAVEGSNLPRGDGGQPPKPDKSVQEKKKMCMKGQLRDLAEGIEELEETKDLQARIREVHAAQQGAIIALLSLWVSRHGSESTLQTIETEALVGTLDSETWAPHFEEVLRPAYERLIARGVNAGVRDISQAIEIDESPLLRVVDDLLRDFQSRVLPLDGETLRGVLTQSLKKGETIAQLQARIEAVYGGSDDFRAGRVARSEIIRVLNAGAVEAWRQTGVVSAKRWLASSDACKFCLALDGQQVGLVQQFVGAGEPWSAADGETMIATYGDIQHPPAHPNCRCTLVGVT